MLDEDEALPFFRKALEAGINFFDTADVYSQGESERVTGKALKEYANRDNWDNPHNDKHYCTWKMYENGWSVAQKALEGEKCKP